MKKVLSVEVVLDIKRRAEKLWAPFLPVGEVLARHLEVSCSCPRPSSETSPTGGSDAS